MADLCKHCGKVESEHHAFEAKPKRVRWPKGCKCDRADWLIPPTAICAEYLCSSYGPNCAHCSHDSACHAPKD